MLFLPRSHFSQKKRGNFEITLYMFRSIIVERLLLNTKKEPQKVYSVFVFVCSFLETLMVLSSLVAITQLHYGNIIFRKTNLHCDMLICLRK